MTLKKEFEKASFLDKFIWKMNADNRILDKYKEEKVKEIYFENNDYLDYIQNDNIVINNIKLLICHIMLCRNHEVKKLPSIRKIPDKAEIKVSKSQVHRYLSHLEVRGWIKKINRDSNNNIIPVRNQYYKITISKEKASSLFNFIIQYEIEKGKNKSLNFKIKKLKKLIENSLNKDRRIEKIIKENLSL